MIFNRLRELAQQTIFLFYAEYLSDDIHELLDQMDLKQIKEIMNELRIIPVTGTKLQRVATIINTTRRQSTIGVKTLKDRVLSEIHKVESNIFLKISFCILVFKKLGDAYQIRTDICEAFSKLYVLATFTEFYSDIQDYFRRFDMIFPSSPIESFAIFDSISSFEKYANALKVKADLEAHVAGHYNNNKISGMSFYFGFDFYL